MALMSLQRPRLADWTADVATKARCATPFVLCRAAMQGLTARCVQIFRAFFVPIKSERRLYFVVLTRFLHADPRPPRIQCGAGSRSKTL
jgi:hypothetical protein